MKEDYKIEEGKFKLRKIVFIVVYTITEDGPEYLLLHRIKRWKGWEFPKGGKGLFERYKTTVRRELFEETGLKPLRIKEFKTFGEYFFNRKLDAFPGIAGQAYKLCSAQVEKKNVRVGDEHSHYRWLKFNEAHKLLKFKNQKDCLEEVNNWLIGKLK